MRKAKTKKSRPRPWSEGEIKLLKRLFPRGRAREIAKRTGRPLSAVRQKAYSMEIRTSGNRPWSANEIRLLKKLYPTQNIQSVADKLGRTVSAVVSRAYKLGLRRSKQYPVWSKRELNLLKKLYPSKMAQQIADQIGRPVQATRKRIVILGLRKRLRLEERHRVVNGAREKLCRKCRKWRGESQFSKNRSSKDGLVGWCKECLSAARKKQR